MSQNIKVYKDFTAIELVTLSNYKKKFKILDRTISLNSIGEILYKEYFGNPIFLGEYCKITNDCDYFYYKIDDIEYVEILGDFY